MKQPKRQTRKKKVEVEEKGTPTVPLSFESPESTTVQGASYDPETLTLRVTFYRPNGDLKTYAYDGIKPDTWDYFYVAGSKGQFFNAQLRPFYAGRPV